MGNLFSRQPSKRLVILRGLPGSGKTTLAKKLAGNNGLIFSTNDYFYQKDGIFKFNPKKLRDAHLWNQDRASKAMANGEALIIINNNNVRRWEAKPYVEVGKKYDYNIEFIEPDTPWKRDIDQLVDKDCHGVPIKVIQAMLRDWEEEFTVENVLESVAPYEL